MSAAAASAMRSAGATANSRQRRDVPMVTALVKCNVAIIFFRLLDPAETQPCRAPRFLFAHPRRMFSAVSISR